MSREKEILRVWGRGSQLFIHADSQGAMAAGVAVVCGHIAGEPIFGSAMQAAAAALVAVFERETGRTLPGYVVPGRAVPRE